MLGIVLNSRRLYGVFIKIVRDFHVFYISSSFTGGSAADYRRHCHLFLYISGWSSPVARQPHKLKVASSNLAPEISTLPL